jgi:hypothetical protein
VGAQYGCQNEQKAQQDSPGCNPVGVRTETARGAGAPAPARLRLARRNGVALDEHQAPPWLYLAHAAMGGQHCSPDIRGPSVLTGAATLDPLAHILDVGPPGAGLGSSWHRRAMLTARPAADDGLRAASGKNPHGSLEASVAGGGGQEVRDRFGVAALVELGRHLAQAAGSAFGDRIQDERLAPGFGRYL